MKAGHPRRSRMGTSMRVGSGGPAPGRPSPEMDESLGFRDIMITSITTDGDDDDVA